MSGSTVLRVKRRIEDNPQDALVIMCKRVKTENTSEEISPSLFVFRGTVENQNTIVKNIVPKTEKLKSTPDVQDIIQKLRKARKDHSSESRYEVVNCSRGLKDDEEDMYDLLDLKRRGEEESDIQYAYDLYTAAKQDFDLSMVDDIVRIDNIASDLLTGYRDKDSSDEADDDDDSNDENNWRNEYPDSDPSSIDEEDMIRAMERVDIGEDLSSDDNEDIYETPYKDDEDRYGPAYAKYKAKVLAEVSPSTGLIQTVKVKDLDEESVEGYKEDSDDGFYYGSEQDTDQFREQYANDLSDEYSPD